MLLLHNAVWGKGHTWQRKNCCLRAEATALLFARTPCDTRSDGAWALAIIWAAPAMSGQGAQESMLMAVSWAT